MKASTKKTVSRTPKKKAPWPQDLSFQAFKNFSPASESWVCKTIFELRGDQISIRNQRIGTEKLARILRATFKLSASKGFDSMSLRQLSAESSISMGGLYSYIGSKEELANLIEHGLAKISIDLTDDAIEGISTTKHRLSATIASHIYLSEQLKPWFYFVYMESKSLSKMQKARAKQSELDFEARLFSLIEQGIEEGTFAPVDITLTSSALMALLQDWHLKQWKYRKRKITTDQYANFVLDLAMSQLGTERDR